MYEINSRRLQAAKQAIIALGSDIPPPEFIDLVAGWECFTRTGIALPQETAEYVCLFIIRSASMTNFSLVSILRQECDCALFGSVRYVSMTDYDVL